MLQSFRWVRCEYTHFDNPAHHYLYALRLLFQSFEYFVHSGWFRLLVFYDRPKVTHFVHDNLPLLIKILISPCCPGIQYVSAQKQAPSAIDFLGSIKEAVSIERRLARAGAPTALKDMVNKCVSAYNKMVTSRSHRIDTGIKNMITNLFFGLTSFGFVFFLCVCVF